MAGDPVPDDITNLLLDWRAGDPKAKAQLFERIYPELRQIAANRVRGLWPGVTLRPTELIHETWLRLAESEGLSFDHRGKFYAMAAVIMRHILVDRARARRSLKRQQTEDWPIVTGLPNGLDYPEISQAIDALEGVCERQARQVDLRFFGGFTAAEAAEILGVSSATLRRDWVAARMFIKQYLEPSA